MFADIIKVIIL